AACYSLADARPSCRPVAVVRTRPPARRRRGACRRAAAELPRAARPRRVARAPRPRSRNARGAAGGGRRSARACRAGCGHAQPRGDRRRGVRLGWGGACARTRARPRSRRMILLTGFEPFGPYTTNPSGEVAKALDGRAFGAETIRAVVLPVHHAEAAVAVARLVDE